MRQKDTYTIKAKAAGLRARSAYKLFQINKRYRLIKTGDDVLDLGCWPGGWLIAAKRLGARRVAGIDIMQIEPISGVEFIKGDVLDSSTVEKVKGSFDVLLSDMAPKTSGILSIDIARSIELAEAALNIARRFLKPKGNFLVKIFQGEGFGEFFEKVKKHFAFVKTTKPAASKARSKEVYIVGLGFKG